MGERVGIDLGTTYSAISWYDAHNKRVEVVDLSKYSDGEKILDSVVYYPGEGEKPVAGKTARNAAVHAPERVISLIKRDMGTDRNPDPIDGVQLTPPMVSAEILKALIEDAKDFLDDIEGAVITVPAYFGDNERAATEEAAQLAGINLLALLSEPNAAALAYAVQKLADINDNYFLVYDLGGGTFDVTLIQARTGDGDSADNINLEIEVLCKEGDMELGGADWDNILVDLAAEKVMQEHNFDIFSDPKIEAFLRTNCEKAKKDLSKVNSTMVVADFHHHQVEITLSEFEDRSRPLLDRSEALVREVLEKAETEHGISKDQITVLLAGGSSKMPMVSKMLESLTGKPPLTYRNPELSVTTGAAYWAHLMQGGPVPVPVPDPDTGKTEEKDLVLTEGGLMELTAYAVGVMVLRSDGAGGVTPYNSVIIPSGEKYGETFEKVFNTSEDGMTSIPVVLYKGDSEDLAECERLMDFTITGLPAGRPAGRPVQVTIGFNNSGILQGKAIDVDSGEAVDIVIDRSKNKSSS